MEHSKQRSIRENGVAGKEGRGMESRAEEWRVVEEWSESGRRVEREWRVV
jgi:hypothetical protein